MTRNTDSDNERTNQDTTTKSQPMNEKLRVLLDAEDRDIKEIITVLSDEMDDYPPEMIIVDEEDLDELVDAVGGPENKPEDTAIYSEDSYTRRKVEFNLIVFGHEYPDLDDGTYGTATQIRMPTRHFDTVLDLRENRGGFSSILQGLGGDPEHDSDESPDNE